GARGYPAPVALELLARLKDARFTTELARYNLEANIAPRVLKGDFLRALEEELSDVVRTVEEAAAPLGVGVLLTGILPSLRRSDLAIQNLTPEHRYRLLNESL